MKKLLMAAVCAAALVSTIAVAADTTGSGSAPAASIAVFTNVSTTVVVPGGFGDAECDIQNQSLTRGSTVDFKMGITYADGAFQEFTGLGSPVDLPPDNGTVISIFYIVDPNAAPGPATFTCKARGRLEGSSGPPYVLSSDSSSITVAVP